MRGKGSNRAASREDRNALDTAVTIACSVGYVGEDLEAALASLKLQLMPLAPSIVGNVFEVV